nr:hypothetical protein L204_05542 [Cryptococcus depauperatus CBS 7855]
MPSVGAPNVSLGSTDWCLRLISCGNVPPALLQWLLLPLLLPYQPRRERKRKRRRRRRRIYAESKWKAEESHFPTWTFIYFIYFLQNLGPFSLPLAGQSGQLRETSSTSGDKCFRWIWVRAGRIDAVLSSALPRSSLLATHAARRRSSSDFSWIVMNAPCVRPILRPAPPGGKGPCGVSHQRTAQGARRIGKRSRRG